MKLSYINGFGNKGNTFVAKGISTESLPYQTNSTSTPQYLTPDYFLPSSQSESYYGRKFSSNHSISSSIGSNSIYQVKSSKISRYASVMLLSLSFLATAVKVDASPSLDFEPASSYATQSPLQQQVNFQSSQQQPKKKSLLTRAAHKISKRLGFSGIGAATREPEISMEELKELYTAEYGESMDDTISRGDGKTSGLAEALKKSLALREKTLERRKAEDIFTSKDIEDIYSKPLDTISIASSSTEYSEPWSDPDIEISEAFKDEFSTSKKQQRFEPSAPPLSRYSSFSSGERIERRDIKLRREELEAIELIDQAIEDSGYSSPSISNSASISSSPTNEVGFQGGYETDISNYSSFDTSSTEYDTEAEIRAYENAEVESQNKKLKTRKARNARAAEARYRYHDIEQGLGELHSDTDFSDGSSDEDSASATDGYDTVYTSSSSEYSNDETSEWDTDFSDDNSNKDDAPLQHRHQLQRS